jgi:hypothetical protein
MMLMLPETRQVEPVNASNTKADQVRRWFSKYNLPHSIVYAIPSNCYCPNTPNALVRTPLVSDKHTLKHTHTHTHTHYVSAQNPGWLEKNYKRTSIAKAGRWERRRWKGRRTRRRTLAYPHNSANQSHVDWERSPFAVHGAV